MFLLKKIYMSGLILKHMVSVADIPIKVDLFGVGVLSGLVIRHVCPLSADAILDKIPFVMRGRFSFGSKKYWTIPDVGIRKGIEKGRVDVNKGDIIYSPKTDELILILEDQEMPNSVNYLGKITDNLESVLNARNGLNTKFSKVK